MVMEDQVDWVLVLGALAAIGFALAIAAFVFALGRRGTQEVTSEALTEALQAREAAERRTLEILNAIPVALVETDKQGKFVFANRAAHQLLGRRDAELLGLRFHSATWGITYPDGRPVPPDLLPSARALRGQTVKGFQHLLANPATRRRMLVSVTAMPIENVRGEVIGSTAAIVETEGLTEPAVEPAAAPEPAAPSVGDRLVRRVFEAASTALVVIDVEGRVREANPPARALAGRGDLMLGGDFADLFLAEPERDAARAALAAALSAPAGEARLLEAHDGPAGGMRWRLLPLIDETGAVEALVAAAERIEAEVPVEAVIPSAPEDESVTPAQPAGDPALTEALARAWDDLRTARAEADALREAAAQAESDARGELEAARRLESVGRLTGGVSQDFSALLGVMTSALDMILKQADEPDRVRRLGRAALAAGQRGEALTRRLAAFSDGQDGPPAQRIDLGTVVRGSEGRLRAAAGPTVDLLIETPSEPMEARIDPVALDAALVALVTNAAQATGGQGSVAVRLVPGEDGGALISVRDDGAGMTEDVARRAMEPFFTTREGAAGLGLAQVHAFARQSAGNLSIDSVPERGTEVTLNLPARD